MMIPPSVVFIVYAIMTEQSIGRLFIAGVVPGILTTLLFCIAIYLQCVRRPELGLPAPSSSWKAKVLSLGGTWETILLFAGVMGGMFFGIFTPTEGAAIGAAGTVVITAVGRKFGLAMLSRSLQETLRTSVMVMIIVTELGFDPIWFGVMIVLVTQMGVITPPVGVCVYVVSGIERDVPLQTIFRGAMPFLLAMAVAAILLIAFPWLCLFLPNLIH